MTERLSRTHYYAVYWKRSFVPQNITFSPMCNSVRISTKLCASRRLLEQNEELKSKEKEQQREVIYLQAIVKEKEDAVDVAMTEKRWVLFKTFFKQLISNNQISLSGFGMSACSLSLPHTIRSMFYTSDSWRTRDWSISFWCFELSQKQLIFLCAKFKLS